MRWSRAQGRRVRTAAVALCAGGLLLSPAPAARADMPWRFSRPFSAERAPDGSILVAETKGNVIRRMKDFGDPAPAVVAGQPSTAGAGYAGDGGPATAARLWSPTGVASLPDGGFLVADANNNRVRRVSADGTIVTVAGGGLGGSGCLATRARLYHPWTVAPMGDGGFVTATVHGVFRVWRDGSITAVAPELDLWAVRDAKPQADGSILIAHSTMVTRVAPDGTGTVVAGSSASGDTGDGGPATEAAFGMIAGLAPLADGGFLVLVNADDGRLRRVRPDGIVVPFGPPRIRYAEGVSADPLGGAIVSDADDGTVTRYADPTVRPAPPPQPGDYDGTGGYAGACMGLDPSFAGGGVVAPRRAYDGLQGMARTPDGRLLLAATFRRPEGGLAMGVARLLPDGEVDTGFGASGVALPPAAPAGADTEVSGMVRQSGGRIVLVGIVRDPQDPQLMVIGLRPDGSLDPGFASGGVYRGTELIRPWPRIAVGPSDELTIATSGGSLMRLTPDGRPDARFGGDGVVETGSGAEALAAEPDGGVLLLPVPPTPLSLTQRFLPDGRRDTGFRPVDPTEHTAGGWSWHALAAGADGRITAVGARHVGEGYLGRVVRLNRDGSLDGGFGEGGLTNLANVGSLYGIVLHGERTTVLGAEGFGVHLAARLGADGRPDPGFGTAGRVTTWIGGGGRYRAGAVLPDGRLVAAGEAVEAGLVVARYRADGDSEASGEPAGAGGGDQPGATSTQGDGAAAAGPSERARPRSARARRVLRVRVARSTTAAALRRGLRVQVTGGRAGTVRLVVRRAGHRRSLVARGVRLRRSGTVTVVLRVRAHGARRLIVIARQGAARTQVAVRVRR